MLVINVHITELTVQGFYPAYFVYCVYFVACDVQIVYLVWFIYAFFVAPESCCLQRGVLLLLFELLQFVHIFVHK